MLGHVAALTIALATPRLAVAFDSYPGGTGHDRATRDAARDSGLSRGTTHDLKMEVRHADLLELSIDLRFVRHRGLFGGRNTESLLFPNCRYDPAHHFDREPQTSTRDAYEAGRQFVMAKRAQAIAAAKQRRDADALRAMGRALHAIQDFYSHSNVVDLPLPTQHVLSDGLWNAGPFPEGVDLVVAEFDGCPADPDLTRRPPTRRVLVAQCSESLADTHLCMSKDSPASVMGRQRTADGTRMFRRALDLAKTQSKRFLDDVSRQVGQQTWDRLSRARTGVR